MQYIISILLIIIVTIAGIFKWWARKSRLYWEKQGIHYADVNSFVISVLFRKNVHKIILELHKKHGRIYGSFEFGKPVITVSEPELLRDILVKDFPSFNYRRDIPCGDKITSNLIVTMKGDDWKRVRTIITPAFTSRRMRYIAHIINDISNTVVEVLRKYADERKPVEFRSLFGAFTLDVIAKAIFATKIDSLNNPESVFVKKLKSIAGSGSLLRFLLLLILPEWLAKRLKFGVFPHADFFKSVVLQVIKERKETGKKYDDMLQLLLDAKAELENEQSNEAYHADEQEDESDQFGSVTNSEVSQRSKYKKMSEDELIAQCIMFLLVGYATTASTLTFIAYSLAVNPVCQQKLIAEIDEVFKTQKELNYDAIRGMKYLDCVLSETLRMYPVMGRSERTACEDYKLGNTGITIKKGTVVGFNIHALHYDPEFFKNPENFYPERFLAENISHPQYAYLPFGAGPRNCLGMRFALMEMKLLLSHILRHYTFKIAENTKVPLELRNSGGLLDVDELFLAVERRNI